MTMFSNMAVAGYIRTSSYSSVAKRPSLNTQITHRKGNQRVAFITKLNMTFTSNWFKKYAFFMVLALGLPALFFYGTFHCKIWPKKCDVISGIFSNKPKQALLHHMFDLKVNTENMDFNTNKSHDASGQLNLEVDTVKKHVTESEFQTNMTWKSKSVKASIKEVKDYNNFEEALADRASDDEIIVLSSLDLGYVDMALNLWETSFVNFGIKNFLFVCSDLRAQQALHKKNIPCFLGQSDSESGHVNSYGTAGFIRKTHIKTRIVLEALKLGYSVLLVDVDIVFFKNPFLFFDCSSCDLQVQTDGPEINSGFYFVRATKPAITLHADALKLAEKSKGLSNQKALQNVLNILNQKRIIKTKILSTETFPVGNIFFENGKRMFADDAPCTSCVLVHDNWIVGSDAKIYRLKEFLLWVIDKNQYYSSKTRKYLTFDNPIDFSSNSLTYEATTLRMALAIGYLLNRTVILPTFHCYGCNYQACKVKTKKCSLNTHFRIKTFDLTFSGRYREHMFLNHPKVPAEIKESQSEVILIESTLAQKHIDRFHLPYDKKYTPQDLSVGAMPEEILNWFSTPEYQKFQVLRFHSLYGAFAGLSDKKHTDFNSLLNKGITYAGYRQY